MNSSKSKKMKKCHGDDDDNSSLNNQNEEKTLKLEAGSSVATASTSKSLSSPAVGVGVGLKKTEEKQSGTKNLVKFNQLTALIESVPWTKSEIMAGIHLLMTRKEQQIDDELAQAHDLFFRGLTSSQPEPPRLAELPSLVLDEIFSNLDFPDLLSCRLVSVGWWHSATMKLRKTESAGFCPPRGRRGRGCMRMSRPGHNRSIPYEYKNLDKYVQLMRTSKLQPFTSFYFKSPMPTDVSFFKNFFDVVGPSLEELTWDLQTKNEPPRPTSRLRDCWWIGVPTVDKFRKVLAHLTLPALKKLDLQISLWGTTPAEMVDKAELFEIFLKAAPNLTQLDYVWDDSSSLVPEFVRKNSLLSHLTSLTYCDSDSIEESNLDLDLDLLSQFKKLTELSLSLQVRQPHRAAKMRNFLQSQSRSLAKLELVARRRNIGVDLEFPRLENLTKLVLVDISFKTSKSKPLISGQLIDWPAIFPNLKNLELKSSWNKVWVEGTLFTEKSGVHRKLKTLTLPWCKNYENRPSREHVEDEIARIFPNIEKLKIPYNSTTVGLTNICPRLTKLYSLVFLGFGRFGAEEYEQINNDCLPPLVGLDVLHSRFLRELGEVISLGDDNLGSLKCNLKGVAQICFEVEVFNYSKGFCEILVAETHKSEDWLRVLSRKIRFGHNLRPLGEGFNYGKYCSPITTDSESD